MVFVEQMPDHAWWKQILWKAAEKGSLHEATLLASVACDVPDELRQWRGFEFADIMEEGKGPGLTSMFVEAPDKDAKQDERLIVQLRDERKKFILAVPKGEDLLTAIARTDGLGFDIFVGSEGEKSKALGPSFILRGDQKSKKWSLSSVRCERCEARGTRLCGTRELARIYHYCESIGEGKAFCMDVELPEHQEDGRSNVVCSVCGDDSVGGCVLSSRRPKWNQRQKTLTLDFRGRCSLASAKNFQLESEDKSKVTLLFGKVKTDEFVLDYCYPLGMVQAFAAALTATYWK
eukprot:TRINITY_DN112889_c0_g1_i1.p1 TRINITY_DN112889_c0_g1~~TRINITY_DN112889_c0_g1_i1.p1  ORF type:complete len:308 (+),score=64.20 TRINITY_DN112889_c0_g1_i1:52-924(+)